MLGSPDLSLSKAQFLSALLCLSLYGCCFSPRQGDGCSLAREKIWVGGGGGTFVPKGFPRNETAKTNRYRAGEFSKFRSPMGMGWTAEGGGLFQESKIKLGSFKHIHDPPSVSSRACKATSGTHGNCGEKGNLWGVGGGLRAAAELGVRPPARHPQ